MKNKISKILGLGLTIAVITSLLTVAAPASALTLSWGAETLPSTADTVNQIVVGSDVTDVAVAGNTLYAVSMSATANLTLKSTDGGNNWSRLKLSTDTTVVNMEQPKIVAVAPGDANIVIVVTTNSTPNTNVWYSNDAGTTFTMLTGHTMTIINSVAISPLTASARNITLAGISSTAAGADIQYISLGGLVPGWISLRTSADWTPSALAGTTSVLAIAYSPNFAGDKVLTAATSNGTGTLFEIASFSTKKWNAAASFAGYPATVVTTGAATSAAISLAPTYLGADESLRLGFVAASTGLSGGGLFKLSNASATAMVAGTDYQSVAFNGTDLVAGLFGSNGVSRSANPTAASPTVDAASTNQRPGGVNMVKVAWMGTNVVAGTSGASSAFAVSNDKGATFNDISLIDNAMTNLRDAAVSADGNTVYLVSDDGLAGSAVWRKVGTGNWMRILNPVFATTYFIRIPSASANNTYLFNSASTDLLFSGDGGEKSWLARALVEAPVDAAVESAQVVYAVTPSAKVYKSTNAGFTWDNGTATGLSDAATISSAGTNQVLVGSATGGGVAWSADGSASATTWVAKTGAAVPTTDWNAGATGPVHATANNVSAGGFIYVGMDALNKNVLRWQVGTSTSFSDIHTGTHPDTKGLVLSDGVLYDVGFDSTTNTTMIHRTIIPTTATSSTSWSGAGTLDSTSIKVDRRPTALRVGPLGKLWVVSTFRSGTTTADTLQSITDTTYKTAPTVTAPADGMTPQTNPVTGTAQDLAFNWARLGVTTGTTGNGYQLEVALDRAFTQPIITLNNTGTPAGIPDTSSDPVVVIIGPQQSSPRNYSFSPGTTYYWRVKAMKPLESPFSTVRSFTFTTLQSVIAPFNIKSPEIGASDVAIKPVLSWSADTGNATSKPLWYEVTMSEDPSFAIPEWSHNVNGLVYGVVDPLKFSTTYYWRVRAVYLEPFVQGAAVITPAGPWMVGAFTTMAQPAPVTGPTTPGTTTPIPPVIVTVPGPPQVVTVEKPVPAAIPSWMLMTIIIIGAILVIALLVLIMRTRKTA